MAKAKKIKDQKQDVKKVKGDINSFNLDIGFMEALIDILTTVDTKELNNNTVVALAFDARPKIERMKEYVNSLWGASREAGIAKI